MVYPLVPVPAFRVREAARHGRRGVEAWAGRVSSGGRPRRRRRHAGAGPVAVAGRCGRTSRRPAVALRSPLHGVGGRAGATRAALALPWGARVQGRRRARCGPHCGPRDQRQAGSVAWGPRPGLGAWVRRAAEAEAAPCGCGARGGRRAAQADRPVVGGGPESPTPWGRRARWRGGAAVGWWVCAHARGTGVR